EKLSERFLRGVLRRDVQGERLAVQVDTEIGWIDDNEKRATARRRPRNGAQPQHAKGESWLLCEPCVRRNFGQMQAIVRRKAIELGSCVPRRKDGQHGVMGKREEGWVHESDE